MLFLSAVVSLVASQPRHRAHADVALHRRGSLVGRAPARSTPFRT